MIDLEKMTARELCAGLMRGDRVDMKRGYGPESAALTAAQRKGLDEDDVRRLLDYASGFANGMADAVERNDPAAHYVRLHERDSDDYTSGLADGRAEVGFFLLPALGMVEA